jgi:O-antigen ligase
VSILVPAILAAPTADMMRGLFLCFASAAILNVFFVAGGSPIFAQYGSVNVMIGYPGYFTGKNYLGECATLAFLMSLHEVLYPGRRRVFGITVIVVSIFLVLASDSKTAFGLAFVAPFLAGFALILKRRLGISVAAVPLAIVFCYIIVSNVSNFSMGRISYMLYGDSSFTGRTVIWDFARYEIDRRPIQGWGYQAFWLSGPDAPSVVDAPGWVKTMPNAHNGYYDTMLEMGYIGLAFLVAFIVTTLHGIGRVADRDPARAWLILSLTFFIISFNFLESLWMRGFEFLWIVFIIVAAEVGRYWQHSPLAGAAQASSIRTPGRRPVQGARRVGLRTPF